MSLTHIETIELTSSAASIEFTSIPQDGTDLVLLASAKGTEVQDAGGQLFSIFLNNDSSGSYINLRGYNESVNVSTASALRFHFQPSNFTANTFGNASIYISNYASSNTKSISVDTVAENNGTKYEMEIASMSSSLATGVTSIKLDLEVTGNIDAGSSFSLYKITTS